MRFDTPGILPAAKTQLHGKAECQGHADGDAFAMDEPGRIVTGETFQGMAERMAEVEQRAVACLELVARHDCGLCGAGAADRFHALRAPGENRRAMALAPFEEAAVVDQAVFDQFGVARPELAAG